VLNVEIVGVEKIARDAWDGKRGVVVIGLDLQRRSVWQPMVPTCKDISTGNRLIWRRELLFEPS